MVKGNIRKQQTCFRMKSDFILPSKCFGFRNEWRARRERWEGKKVWLRHKWSVLLLTFGHIFPQRPFFMSCRARLVFDSTSNCFHPNVSRAGVPLCLLRLFVLRILCHLNAVRLYSRLSRVSFLCLFVHLSFFFFLNKQIEPTFFRPKCVYSFTLAQQKQS